MAAYKVKLEIFEGPMDLLMHLIEKDELDIYDIPIAKITEQYLDYLQALKEFNIDIASEFLVMAATLLQIKSRILLPNPVENAALDDEAGDPRQELIDRLLEYRKFKQMAGVMEEMAKNHRRYFSRLPQIFAEQVLLPEGLKLDDLLAAFAAVWESKEPSSALVDHDEFSVQDKMYDILHLLRQNDGSVEFSRVFIRAGTRSEMIVSFLALLELMRLTRVNIRQEKSFAPIYLMLRR
ncbi:MAG: segregation/condensation protein A [Veillonellales bacterium]